MNENILYKNSFGIKIWKKFYLSFIYNLTNNVDTIFFEDEINVYGNEYF